MSMLANSNAIESGGYNIDRSLRFRSSASAYLNRTPASNGNLNTWTISLWLKRGSLGVAQCFIGTSYTSLSEILIRFNSNDTLRFEQYTAGGVTLLGVLETTQVFRDPSAWYHIEYVYDSSNATSSDRVRLYINGTRITAFGTATYPAQNANSIWNNNTNTQYIGRYSTAAYFDGYLAEVNFIDGQALTPSSFGQTDAVTGVWQPKKYTGTYGTNGFYLDFKNNTSATTLAQDKSGNGNNWTPNNISTTAGSTYDSMTDVPTLTSATAANYCTINPLLDTQTYATYSEGNLKISTTAATGYAQRQLAKGTMSIPITGKWYFTISGADCGIMIGDDTGIRTQYSSAYQSTHVRYDSDGSVVLNGGLFATVATYTASDEVGLAIDMNAFTVGIYKNGTLLTTVTGLTSGFTYYPLVSPNSGATAYTAYLNFGQRPFSYTPPTGFKALNTFNLPDPVIKKPNQYMDATTYTGNGGTLAVANSGSMQPDLVWIKSRSDAYNHGLYDSARGVQKWLSSSTTDSENAYGTGELTSFNSNGFTLANSANYINNGSGKTYVGWQWKKGATPGFDIVTYTNPSSGSSWTVNHNLGVAPAMFITKQRSTSSGWAVYHKSLGATQALFLQNTNAASTNNIWNNTAPTSTTLSFAGLGINYDANATVVAYCFAEIPGFSKFGSYTGNGSADGPFVFTNFQPRYILIKQSSAAGEDWIVQDTARKPYNTSGTSTSLFPDSSSAEVNTAAQLWDVTSNGFKIRASGGGVNTNGATYIYAAFASNPFKFSTAF